MKKNKKLWATSTCVALALNAMGCAERASDRTDASDQGEVDQQTQAIIGGVPANSASLNAVGSLVAAYQWTDPYTGQAVSQRAMFCSGSLIGPQTVLTAKHCTVGAESVIAAYAQGARLLFAIGPDSEHPLRDVEIVSVARAPVNEGGAVGMGHDVAVFHLAERVTDVTPLTLGRLDDTLVGKPFATIGYGVQNSAFTVGTRFAGTETLRALSGRTWELIFGTYEAFRDWAYWTIGASDGSTVTDGAFEKVDLSAILHGAAPTSVAPAADEEDAGTPAPDGGTGTEPSIEDEIRALYENTYLLAGYEAFTGGLQGNTQACRGDSGSPLVRTVGGKLRAFGVASGALRSRNMECDYGSIYATFGSDVMPFLEIERKWVDPCKGTSTAGVCDNRTVKRCTKPDEGVRRLVKINCGLLNQTCGLDATGAAACVDP